MYQLSMSGAQKLMATSFGTVPPSKLLLLLNGPNAEIRTPLAFHARVIFLSPVLIF
jgi:hypothetical protein